MLNKQVLMKIVILFGYAGLIFYLLFTGKIGMYLHPKMNLYILVSALILMVLALVAAKDLFKRNHSPKGYTVYGIFLGALMLMVFVQPIALNSILAENRGVTIGNKLEKPNKDLENKLVEIDETETINNQERIVDTELVIEDGNYIEMLDKIQNDLASYKNKSIIISGFVFKDKSFNEQNFVIARSAINCCTADANTIGLMCQFNEASTLENDQWLKVQGVLQETVIEGRKIPLLVISQVEKIAKPQNEYIYLE